MRSVYVNLQLGHVSGDKLGGERELWVYKPVGVQVIPVTRGREALVRIAGCRQPVLLVQLQETVERTAEE